MKFALDADGYSDPQLAQSGRYALDVRGTFGGGTVKVCWSKSETPISAANFKPLKKDLAGTDYSATADDTADIALPQGYVSIHLDGSTDPDIEVQLERIS